MHSAHPRPAGAGRAAFPAAPASVALTLVLSTLIAGSVTRTATAADVPAR